MLIIFASDNFAKLAEIQKIAKNFPFTIVPQEKYAVPTITEIGLTFVENALLKARNAAKITKLPALADDSGLVIDALHGAPGIYSSRYAGQRCSSVANMTKVLAELKGLPAAERTAYFHCTLVYLRYAQDPMPIIAEGSWQGSILTEPRGSNGFGYDPIFYVAAHKCSAAQLPSVVKNRLSHRGQAVRKMVKLLQQQEIRHG